MEARTMSKTAVHSVGAAPGSAIGRRRMFSALMDTLTALCALLVLGLLFILLGYIVIRGVGALNLDFLVNSPKPVGEPGGGIANAIVGTLILVGLGSLFGLPVGILGGIYLSEFGSGRIGTALRFLIDTLTGVPSIIVGVFIWMVLVRPMGHFSALAGGVALGTMMLPVVARTTEEMLRLVPQNLREAALALGAPRWKVTLGVVLRTAAGGVATGAMLALARVAGETAPLLFTALSLNYLSTDLNHPMASLTFQIFYYAGSPYEEWHAMAWAATLVLVTMVLLVNVVVKLLSQSRY